MMKDYIDFLGIQMNCTNDALANAKTISKAILDNPQVDYAVTPECALTGYNNTNLKYFDQALEIVKDAVRSTKTSIFLGSIYEVNQGQLENTCLIINSIGEVVDYYSKSYIIPLDEKLGILPGKKACTMTLPEHPEIKCGIMICNDLWGSPMINAPTIPTLHATQGEANIFIHLTNGDRGLGKTHDKVYWDWHTAWLQMMSRYHMLPIISVDNSTAIDGSQYTGPTSSPSGAWILGRRIVEVPNIGEHNFIARIDKRHLLVLPHENPFINASLEEPNLTNM